MTTAEPHVSATLRGQWAERDLFSVPDDTGELTRPMDEESWSHDESWSTDEDESWSADEESAEVEDGEVERALAGLDLVTEDETFLSGATLRVVAGATGRGEEHWDPFGTNLPLYDTGPSVRSTRLSPNFTVGELVSSGGRAADTARIDPALVRTLQAIRDRVARPVRVTSGYRSWKRNVEVYRARNQEPTSSRHCSGQAADISVAGLSGLDLAKIAVDACGTTLGIGVGARYAHVDVRPKWAAWTYFTGAADRSARAAIEAHRTLRSSTPAPPRAPAAPAPPAPRTGGGPTPDRAAGRVVRGTFTRCATGPTPGAEAMGRQWHRLTGRRSGIFNCRKTEFGSPSLHGEGRAIDLSADASSAGQRAQADAYVAWLVANAVELQCAVVIWNGRIWGWARRDERWRTYRGSNRHTDHIHVELSWEGARHPSPLLDGPVPGIG